MKYLQTNEYLECLESLKFISQIIEKLKNEPYYWKWTIISFHNAIQSVLIMSLKGSNGLLTLKEKSEKAWLKAYNEGLPPSEKLELDTFLNLYKKIKSTEHLCFSHSKKYSPPGDQDWAMKKLNALRNDFIHFGPKFWYIEISGLPKIILDCLDIVIFQCNFSETILFTNSRPKKPIISELNVQKDFFEKLKNEYEKTN